MKKAKGWKTQSLLLSLESKKAVKSKSRASSKPPAVSQRAKKNKKTVDGLVALFDNLFSA